MNSSYNAFPFFFFLYQGSRDNMSIVLITFPAAPKPIAEVVEREKKFEAYIHRRTLGEYNPSIHYVYTRVFYVYNRNRISEMSY